MSQDFGSNPYQSPGASGGASSKVKGPAIALLVVGGIDMAFALYGLAMNLMRGNAPPQPLPPELQDNPFMQQLMQLQQQQGPINLVMSILAIAISGLIIFGGLKMKSLSGYGLAMTASILAMIPCLTIMGCCGVGQGIGIWALVVLLNAEVKSAFR